MKILREYVWDTVRENKRTSIAILISLFLMTTLMTCFCGFVYTMWTDSVALTRLDEGDWHGELFGATYGKDLKQIENYASVQAVLIKGDWESAKLADEGRRKYIISRGANKAYWESMPEKTLITEGRRPSRENELALSKQYFDDYPEAKIGDTLTLPVGKRMSGQTVLNDVAGFQEEESFRQTGTKTYKIVGVMDVTTSSVVPAYTGMTYLDTDTIQPDDQLTVYLRFDPMRSTYKELPALARAIGYEADEYGNYNLKYNTSLLSKYAILSPEQKGMFDHLSFFAVPLMFLVMAVLLVAVFVLVIHNAFALSANEKLTQLGTLSGVGASPRQIRSAVTQEALILIILPLPLGVLFGWLLDSALFGLINASNDIGRKAPDIVLSFGLPAILPAIILSLLTAWLSARIPAAKVGKMLPIEALRYEDKSRHKRIRSGRISSLFGIVGELASNALCARKKSYRTATLSLCLSFVLLTGFLYITSAQKAASSIYQLDNSSDYHISALISDGRPPDQEVFEKLKQTPGVTKSVIFNKLPCATWIAEKDTSDDIEKHLGGFDEIAGTNKYSVIERDGRYRIFSTVIGLERDSFVNYCQEYGIDPAPYFSNPEKALIYNYTEDPEASTRKKSVYRSLLKLKEGQKITFTEKAYDEDTGDAEFTLEASAFVDRLPNDSIKFSRFTLVAVLPMEHVVSTASSMSEKRRFSANNINALFLTDSTGGISYPHIKKVTARIDDILSHYFSSGDYMVSDLAERKEMSEQAENAIKIIVSVLTGLLALIGLSNVWSSISGNLRQRQREFAMLKSVGLSPRQLFKMLFLEGITLGLKPLLLSVPLQAAILGAFLFINEVTLLEYLPYAPFAVILLYTLLVILAILGAYVTGARRIQKENIISAIRNDTI